MMDNRLVLLCMFLFFGVLSAQTEEDERKLRTQFEHHPRFIKQSDIPQSFWDKIDAAVDKKIKEDEARIETLYRLSQNVRPEHIPKIEIPKMPEIDPSILQFDLETKHDVEEKLKEHLRELNAKEGKAKRWYRRSFLTPLKLFIIIIAGCVFMAIALAVTCCVKKAKKCVNNSDPKADLYSFPSDSAKPALYESRIGADFRTKPIE